MTAPGAEAHPASTRASAVPDGDELRRAILSIARDSHRSLQPLPGENELARRLDVNRASIRRVLAQLEGQGILRRHQGATTTIDPVSLQMTVRLEEQLEHSVLLGRLGYVAEVELLAAEIVAVGDRLAAALDCPRTAGSLRADKRWRADGVPAMLTRNTALLPDGRDTLEGIDAAQSVFDLVGVLWGEPIEWEVASPGVESLDETHAALLDLPAGSACMTLDVVGVLRSGRRVFHAFERHRPDIVQYSVVRRLPEPWA